MPAVHQTEHRQTCDGGAKPEGRKPGFSEKANEAHQMNGPHQMNGHGIFLKAEIFVDRMKLEADYASIMPEIFAR
jgi:hypothetical protein